MFEILITILVVSIGLLGLAGLQFAGLRAANSAQERTLAVQLIQDIKERIHANANANYDAINLDGTSTMAGVSCDKSAVCNPAAMLSYDKDQWIAMIARPVLPNLSIAIRYLGAAPNDYYTATLTWGQPGNQHTLSASFTP